MVANTLNPPSCVKIGSHPMEPFAVRNHQFIVCFCKDYVLLQTRRQLLEHAGYTPLASSDIRTVGRWLLTENVAVLILCHTLSKKEIDVISRFHHWIHSSASILCLSISDVRLDPDCAQNHDVHRGPAAFLAAVARLTHRPEQPA